MAYNESTTVEREFALAEFGNIGEIKWDITLCLLLSWTIVCLCLIKGEFSNMVQNMDVEVST